MIIFNETYFTTATILNWKHLLAKDKYKDVVLDSLEFAVNKNRVQIFGFVIMPNHFHLLWHINEGQILEKVKSSLLKFTAQQIKFDLLANDRVLLEEHRVIAKDREFQIWERNALSVETYNRPVLEQKLNYIHENPLAKKWSLANSIEEYKYSSASFYATGIDPFGFLTYYLDDF